MANPAKTVGELGEEDLVSRLIEGIPGGKDIIAGPGDDCAVIDCGTPHWQLLKTDCLVEGIHFAAGTDPALVGAKALKRVLSDIAAMGGSPRHALVTLALNADRPVDEVTGWYAGIDATATAFHCQVVGGETTRLPGDGALISVAMTGEVSPPHCVLRSGASVGDLICVSGRLGGSFESGRHLSFTPRLAEAQWLVANFKPTSMMDLSDGLGSDLPRLAAASGVGYTLELNRIPCHEGISLEKAITDGEDYELLFTLPPDQNDALREEWCGAFPGVDLSIIGEVTHETPVPLSRGWEHYRQA